MASFSGHITAVARFVRSGYGLNMHLAAFTVTEQTSKRELFFHVIHRMLSIQLCWAKSFEARRFDSVSNAVMKATASD